MLIKYLRQHPHPRPRRDHRDQVDVAPHQPARLVDHLFLAFSNLRTKVPNEKKSADWSLLKKTAPDWVAAVAAAAVTMSQNRIFMPF